jgi:hypothetical protein
MTLKYEYTPVGEIDIGSTSCTDKIDDSTRSVAAGQAHQSDPLPSNPSNFSWKQYFALHVLFVSILLFGTIAIVHSGTKSRRVQDKILSASLAQSLSAEKEKERALSPFPNPLHAPKHAKSCGPDAATAIAKGCHMDLLSFTWLPHECYDADLTEDFLAQDNWSYALDRNGTHIVDKQKILSGEVDNGYVTWEVSSHMEDEGIIEC